MVKITHRYKVNGRKVPVAWKCSDCGKTISVEGYVPFKTDIILYSLPKMFNRYETPTCWHCVKERSDNATQKTIK